MQAAARSERARKALDALGIRAAISMTRLVLIVLTVLLPSACAPRCASPCVRRSAGAAVRSLLTRQTIEVIRHVQLVLEPALKTFPHL